VIACNRFDIVVQSRGDLDVTSRSPIVHPDDARQ
jgi:hypothetical protein